MIRNIQDLRKKTGLQVEDRIVLKYRTDSEILEEVFKIMGKVIGKEVLANQILILENNGEQYFVGEEEIWFSVEKN